MFNNFIKYNIIKLILMKIIYDFKVNFFLNMFDNFVIKFIISKAFVTNRFKETLCNLIIFII